MRTRWLIIGGIFLGGLGTLGACSTFRGEPRAAWRGEAEQACLRSGAIDKLPFVKESRAIEGPGTCGADYPLKVAGIASEFTASIGGARAFSTAIKPEATLACPMVPALNAWMNDVVQPAALEWFGQPVSELRTMGSYACRTRNNQSGAKLSEHAFANAIDVGGFKFADGSTIAVKTGWKGDIRAQGFLKTVHQGACRYFKTILGPGADVFHYDHIHLDLARHGSRKSVVCRPAVTIPDKPDAFDPALADANAFDQALPDEVAARPGPKPVQDPSYEQEPDFAPDTGDAQFDGGTFDMPVQ